MNAEIGQTERIRALNNCFRQSMMGGLVLLTSGVASLEDETKASVLAAVRKYQRFDQANDPHNEHDFGSFDIAGTVYFWKIEYYDLDMRYAADDPSDPRHTKRVMTIMRADEY